MHNQIKELQQIKMKKFEKGTYEYKKFIECVSSGYNGVETCLEENELYIKCSGDCEHLFD